MKKQLLFTILAIIGTLYPVSKAHADDFSVGIYPPIFQIQADAPVAIKKDLTLVNASDNPIDLHVVFRLFKQAPNSNGQVQYLSPADSLGPDKDILQKVQLLDGDNAVQDITIGPKQKKTYILHIGLPKDEPPADYYFSVLFLSHQPTDATKNGSQINAGISANVLLSIGPNSPVTGFLEEFSSPWFVETGPVPFTVMIANTSRQFVTPTGQIFIRNMFGQLVGKIDLLPVNILGQSSRYIPSQENNHEGQASRPMALWNEKVLFGPYRANIVVSLSDQGPIFTRSIYFFAMPLQYIGGFFLAIMLIAFVLSRMKHKMKNL